MRTRFPWTITLMLLGDLLRLVALTTGILVVIIAFAAAVGPMSKGRLEPDQALKFLALALVPMLQFALPFSSGFAATLVFHRFASENESLAAHAGGISHRGLLASALVMGLTLGLFLGGLSQGVIPWFYREMQKLIATDIARLVMSTIQSGQSVRFSGKHGFLLHADSAELRDPTPYGATDHLALRGVLATGLDSDDRIEWEASSRVAGVWVFPDQAGAPGGVVRIRLVDGTMARRGEAAATSSTIDLRPISLGGVFKDQPKFYSLLDLERLRANPDPIPSVSRARRDLASAMEVQRVSESLASAIRHDGRIRLLDAEGASVSIGASGLTPDGARWRIEPARAGRPVELSWRLGADRARLQTAERAFLVPDDPAVTGMSRPTLRLELENVSTQDPTGETPGATARSRQTFSALAIPDGEGDTLLGASSAALLARADAASATGIREAAARLRGEIASVRREITSRHHERAALSLSCLVMVLTGAIVALRLREARPLLVYLWSFFPSLVAIITITGGQGVMHRSGWTGALLLWGGVAALGVFTTIEYARLRRH